ncbi:MAG TPA: arginine--tRNA ligase [Candidatus Limnocylindrales bacterium]|nr:arginine--tRNA ligase [Candidatus Limnocylindrales bacterium]
MKQQLEQAVRAAVRDVYAADSDVELTRPDEQFGDYATNVALQLAGRLSLPPRQIAEGLAGQMLEQLADVVQDITIAGPGFLNFRLHDAVLGQQLRQTVRPDGAASRRSVAAADRTDQNGVRPAKVLVDYSDPNPFKPLHAGHLYTTLVGDVLARLIERSGAEVVRLNYGGDVGLHVGRCMWAIVQYLGGEHPNKLHDIPEGDRPAWLGARYVEGTTAYEEDETAKQEIIVTNKRVYELHATNDHDSPFAQIYWTCRDWSYRYFDTFYEQLEVRPFDRYMPESEVTPLGLQTVREQLEKGVYEESEGAVVFKGEKYGLHTRVFINSAGLPTYEAKEVGLLLTKWRDYQFDRSIIITANEQDQYMQVALNSIEQFEPVAASRTEHITHGVVKLQGGVKMSSRRGNIVSALDIIQAARQAGQESGLNPSEQTILAAIKYALLKVRIGGDVVYDPKESIALEGNSGPYLQYAHARARSILAKAQTVGLHAETYEPGERSLARKLTEYDEVIDKAVAELMPHYICTYLYELAQSFNSFYEHNRVIGSEREQQRLTLVAAYADTLKDGLELLGIAAPDSM